jgi:hypothetical protein
MEIGQAAGPDNMPAEVLRAAGPDNMPAEVLRAAGPDNMPAESSSICNGRYSPYTVPRQTAEREVC